MNRKEYKKSMSGIHPSGSAVERIMDMTYYEEKSNKKLTIKRLACTALALALVAGSSFGINAAVKNNDQPLSVMVAYASDNGKLSFGRKSPQKPFYGIYVAPYDDKKASDEAFNRWQADTAKLEQDIADGPDDAGYTRGRGGYPCYRSKDNKETAYFYTLEGGGFALSLEDYTDVKSFAVENKSIYGLLQFEYCVPDEEIDKYPILKDDTATEEERQAFLAEHPEFNLQNHKWLLTGDELRYTQKAGYGSSGFGKYEENKGYSLYWATSEELQYAIGDNPEFDLSQIKDTITFTVEFNDGTVKTASLNLYFDSDGYMHFE